MAKDYYQILGVKKTADGKTIQYAYQVKINNDNLTNSEKQLIIEAYQTLIDDVKRRDYDMINDNMQIRSRNMEQQKFYTYSYNNEKPKVIPKWKIIMWLIVIVVIALLIVVALIWGFISLLPIILFVFLIYLIIKIIRGRK